MAEALGFPALKKGGHDKNLVGYFVADTGMINQLVHIWKSGVQPQTNALLAEGVTCGWRLWRRVPWEVISAAG